MHRIHEPSHLDETFVLLEPRSILHAPEVSVSIVVKDRGNFCRPNVWVIQVPISSSSSLLDATVEKGLTW